MVLGIARTNGEAQSFGSFLRSSPLAPTAERDSSGLLKKCGATWLHNRCVWTGNKLPDTTKIQVKLEAIATAVRQRKSEISSYDVVPVCSLLILLTYILRLLTYSVDLTYNRKRAQVVPTRNVGLQHCSLAPPRFLPFKHLLTPSIGRSHKVATIIIAQRL